MLKLMLKRFILSGVIFLLCLVIIYSCAYIFVAIDENIPNMKPLMQTLTYILCGIGTITFVFILKMRNIEVRARYLEHLETTQMSFKNDCLFVLKSQEHLASLIVVNCIFVPIELSSGLNGNWPVLAIIFGSLLMILGHNIAFVVLDCALWLLTFALKCKKNPIAIEN